ncbi:MAG: molecular chaperone [Spirochaetales bacterium]|nr:molecular chaperone [Spirochaetales bacterium]
MRKKTILITTLLLFGVISVFSFQLTPISAELTPTGSGSIQNFKVLNNTGEIIAVQLSMHTRSTMVTGEEINEPADHLFIVYPAQIILKPGDEQIVRVQWKGETELAVERPFRIIAEQLPVDFSQESSVTGGLKIMFRYIGSVYVGDKIMKSDVKVDKVERRTGLSGQDELSVTLYNSGTAHAILDNLKLNLTDSNGNILKTLEGESLDGIEGENILAGEKREFALNIPPDLTERELNANISYRDS